MKSIQSVAIQGRGNWYDWVTGFHLYYSTDGQRWTGYSEEGDSEDSTVSAVQLTLLATPPTPQPVRGLDPLRRINSFNVLLLAFIPSIYCKIQFVHITTEMFNSSLSGIPWINKVFLFIHSFIHSLIN